MAQNRRGERETGGGLSPGASVRPLDKKKGHHRGKSILGVEGVGGFG